MKNFFAAIAIIVSCSSATAIDVSDDSYEYTSDDGDDDVEKIIFDIDGALLHAQYLIFQIGNKYIIGRNYVVIERLFNDFEEIMETIVMGFNKLDSESSEVEQHQLKSIERRYAMILGWAEEMQKMIMPMRKSALDGNTSHKIQRYNSTQEDIG